MKPSTKKKISASKDKKKDKKKQRLESPTSWSEKRAPRENARKDSKKAKKGEKNSWDSVPSKKDKKKETKKNASKMYDFTSGGISAAPLKKKKKVGGDFDDNSGFGESDYFPDIKKLKKDAG